MKKKWFEIVDYYRLTSLLCFWTASWLFMMPHQTEMKVPLYDNLWGVVFGFFGGMKSVNSSVQNKPDMMCALLSLILMTVMQIRGFYSMTLVKEEKNSRLFTTIMNLFSILVHTLFFTVIIKVFIFGADAFSSFTFVESMKTNFWLTMFCVFCAAGMLFGVESLAKLLFLVLVVTGISRNIAFESDVMGVTGFIAILISAAGFYLDFAGGGIDKEKIVSDILIFSGHYKALVSDSLKDSEKLTGRFLEKKHDKK